MPRRELHTYEYVCDGYLRHDGKKCTSRKVVSAYDANAADAAITEPTLDSAELLVTGRWGWAFTRHGWLCHLPHRDDPRVRD
jgi:hypothetical protein